MNEYNLGEDFKKLFKRIREEGIEVKYTSFIGAIEYSFNVENLTLEQLDIVKKVLGNYKNYQYCNIAISTAGITTKLGEFEDVASVSFSPQKGYSYRQAIDDVKTACYSKNIEPDPLAEKLISLINVLKTKNIVLRIEVEKEDEEYTIKVVKKLKSGKNEFLQGGHYKRIEEAVVFLNDLKKCLP